MRWSRRNTTGCCLTRWPSDAASAAAPRWTQPTRPPRNSSVPASHCPFVCWQTVRGERLRRASLRPTAPEAVDKPRAPTSPALSGALARVLLPGRLASLEAALLAGRLGLRPGLGSLAARFFLVSHRRPCKVSDGTPAFALSDCALPDRRESEPGEHFGTRPNTPPLFNSGGKAGDHPGEWH